MKKTIQSLHLVQTVQAVQVARVVQAVPAVQEIMMTKQCLSAFVRILNMIVFNILFY
jgi:hypothetical protein